MSLTTLDGWAITRIPPEAPYMTWPAKGTMSIVGVSDVILEEDFVGCVRRDATNAWIPALKL